jgi:hypothetical protein
LTVTALPTTDEIKARFGGRDLVFKIPRDQLEGFEIAIGEPAAVRFRRIVAGMASAEQVREVIEYAAPTGLGQPIPQSKIDADGARMIRLMRSNSSAAAPRTFVSNALSSRPPARYALLAQAVIAACIYGLPAEAAVFDEDDDGVDGGSE